ncbi:MAG TPA: hypothetical protein VNH13_04385 [Candidatus Acidoferrales bacterium]|nr:hypothetical protein [Candidatus Acidoferrales bacterium]
MGESGNGDGEIGGGAGNGRRIGGAGLLGILGILGLVAIEAAAGREDWLWLAIPILGLLLGGIAGSPGRVWLAVGASIVGDAAGRELGLDALRGPYWFLLLAGHAGLIGLAFIVGTAVVWQRRGLGRRWRNLVVGVVAISLVAFVGYAGVVGYLYSADYVNQPGSGGCQNPASEFGWTYEAVNYDLADDARLLAADPDPATCKVPASTAGSTVVSTDGTPLAGWYVPAGDAAVGPTGPTLVLAHGGKSNKSGMLKYATPFHQAYNLLLVDLRNSGRSGATLNSGGVHERFDIRAMVDWLARTKHPSWLALVANSNGAAAGLAEAVDDARIRALVLDSMQADIVTQLGNVGETEEHLPAWPGAWAVIVGAGLRVGGDLQAVDPIRMLPRLGDRPVLLLHGSADAVDRPRDSLERNVVAALDAGIDVSFHVCEGAPHGQVIDTCPDAWATWATAFLHEARG